MIQFVKCFFPFFSAVIRLLCVDLCLNVCSVDM